MDFRHLRYFVAVSATGNLSRAAARLHVAQPALSRQVHALEQELGVALLERHPKGVTPTVAGQGFARGAAQVLGDTVAALESAEATAAGRRGRVVLGAMRATIANGFVPGLEEALRRTVPEIELVVQVADPRDSVESLASGEVDAIIGTGQPRDDVAFTPLWEEPVDHVLLPSGHPLTLQSQVSVGELTGFPLVVAPHAYPAAMVDAAISVLRDRGLDSPLLAVDGGLHAAHLAVAAGRGWTLVVRALASMPPQGTAVVPLDGEVIKATAGMSWRTGEVRPVIGTLLEAATEVAKQFPAPVVPHPPPRLPPAPVGQPRRRAPGTVPPALAIRHLRALLEVAAAQTIGRAAERLGVTQPALSRQLKELEAATGLSLLDRSARGVMLTSAGSTLAARCPGLLRSMERLVQEAVRARRGMEGRCVIGTVPTSVTSDLLRAFLAVCTERHPGIHIEIEDLASMQQGTALVRGDIDIGLSHPFRLREDEEGLAKQRIVEDRIDCAILDAKHPLAGRDEVEPVELAEVPFLFTARRHNPQQYDRLMGVLATLGLYPRVEGTQDRLYAVWALVAQGKGWCLGFRSQRTRPPSGTVAVPVAGLDLPWGIDLLTRRSEASPAVRAVKRMLRDASRQLDPV